MLQEPGGTGLHQNPVTVCFTRSVLPWVVSLTGTCWWTRSVVYSSDTSVIYVSQSIYLLTVDGAVENSTKLKEWIKDSPQEMSPQPKILTNFLKYPMKCYPLSSFSQLRSTEFSKFICVEYLRLFFR